MLLHLGFCFDILDEQEAEVGGLDCEVVWLRKLFSELFGHVLDTIVILCDNQSGIRFCENLVFHDRSKHFDVWYHLSRIWYSEVS